MKGAFQIMVKSSSGFLLFVIGLILNSCGQTQPRYGYIDHSGRLKIEAKFDCARSFREGLAAVNFGCADNTSEITGGKWGFINQQGLMVIKPIYDSVGDFHEGLAWIYNKSTKKLSYVNRKGKELPTLDMQRRDGFSQRRANDFSEGRAVVWVDGGFSYISQQGEVSSKVYYAAEDCSNGLCIVRNAHKKYEFVDVNGKFQFAPEFDEVSPFSGGLALVSVFYKNTRRYGYINKQGKLVVPVALIEASDFSEGLAAVVDSKDKKWKFINTRGSIVITPNLIGDLGFGDFSEGMVKVEIGGLWGYMNNSGKLVINPQFSDAEDFSEGLAAVEKDDQWQYIDKRGNTVIKNGISGYSGFSNGLALVKINVER